MTFLSKAGAGRTIAYVPKKQILFEYGKRGNAVFYILTRTVKLTVVSQGKGSHNWPARPRELHRQGMHSNWKEVETISRLNGHSAP